MTVRPAHSKSQEGKFYASKPDAWQFIQDQMSIIEKVSFKLSRSSGALYEDLKQDSIIRLHEKHTDFSTTKSSPATWIYWVVRECATKQNRKRRFHIMGSEEPLSLLPFESTVDIESKILASQLLDMANAEQKEAMQSVMDELSAKEVSAKLGISNAGRNARIYRFKKTHNIGR